jgi:hypothetical protein
MGLFEVESFLDAQKCGWVLRSKKDPPDNWKILLNSQMLHHDIVFNKEITVGDETLVGIISAFKRFYKKILGTSNNFKRAPLVANKFFTTAPWSNIFITPDDIRENVDPGGADWFNSVTISKLTENGNLIARRELERKLNVRITVPFFAKIRGVYNTAFTKFKMEETYLGLNVTQSFRTWRRGSRRFRNVLTSIKTLYVPHNLVKFALNTDTVINISCSKFIGQLWSMRMLSNAMRTVLFKMYNNILPYNTLLRPFVRGKSRNCTICDVTGDQDINDETVLHLFYNCNHVHALITQFYNTITGGEVTVVSRHEMFCCFSRLSEEKNFLLCIASKIFIFYIWECKLRETVPVLNHLLKFFSSEVRTFNNISKIFRHRLRQSGYRWHF